MACRNAYKTKNIVEEVDIAETSISEPVVAKSVSRLLFGVDSKIQANDLLQNNIEEFEWVVRNKIYPNFYGRYLTGENCLTREEIDFLHDKGCKIAPIFTAPQMKDSEEHGEEAGAAAVAAAQALAIPAGTAIFMELAAAEELVKDFLRGYANVLLRAGYTPGFMANTDAAFGFDREFSRGMQVDKDVFDKCLVWATAPSLKEYDRVTTTHLIHPDNWTPFAPSGITRAEIAIWQYGVECHPIEDDMGKITTFNLDLVRNEQVIIDKMF